MFPLTQFWKLFCDSKHENWPRVLAKIAWSTKLDFQSETETDLVWTWLIGWPLTTMLFIPKHASKMIFCPLGCLYLPKTFKAGAALIDFGALQSGWEICCIRHWQAHLRGLHFLKSLVLSTVNKLSKSHRHSFPLQTFKTEKLHQDMPLHVCE